MGGTVIEIEWTKWIGKVAEMVGEDPYRLLSGRSMPC